jgi:predicted dehydrogenase
LKALIVGYGSIGRRHIENLSKLKNIEIIIYSKRKNDKFLKQNKCIIYSSIRDCLKEKPDFAIITNETRFHIRSALTLAKSGIHLLIEKPLSDNLRNTKKLFEIAQKKKLIVLVGCNLRFHPSIILIRNMILQGNLGKIISTHVENGSFLPDWHPNENYQTNYAARNDLGGGVVLTCIHEIDYLYWFFGSVSNVYSITGRYSDLKITADDLSAIIIKFKNNIIAEAHLDYFQQPSTRNCKIIGTKGTLFWNMEKNSVTVYDIKNKKWITKLKQSNFNLNETYVRELDHFLKCIQGKIKPINDLKQGIYSLKIALAIKRSSKLKKSISVNK